MVYARDSTACLPGAIVEDFAVIKCLLKGVAVLSLAVLAGCAGATVSQETESAPVTNSAPSQIVVYPFATNPDEVTLNSGILQREYRDISGANVDEQQAQIAKLTAQNVCLQVVNALTKRGYNALCQKRGMAPGGGNVLVVDGDFTDINEGNRLRRMVIGFGVGASVLDTNVYVYQPAPGGGQHQVLSFNTHADSGEMPGVAVTGPAGAAAGGAAAAATIGANVAAGGVRTYRSTIDFLGDKTAQQIDDALIKYFQQQGWPAVATPTRG